MKLLTVRLSSPASYFRPDYIRARECFLDSAARAGAYTQSYENPVAGRLGETLGTDVAILGNINAPSVLLVQSGTHGAEGYCGSAIQVAFLELIASTSIARDTAVILVHGINPFGFSWYSRGDENNVDLNRNFINFFDASQKRNDIFPELAPYLIPSEWTRNCIAEADAKLGELRQRYGHDIVSQSLRRGQYSYPENLFYGGTGPSWSRLTVERIAHDYLDRATKLIFLDIHSGLGNYGTVGLLSVELGTSEKFKVLQKIFGSLVKSTHDPQSDAANANGNIIRGYSEQLADTMFLGVGVEFGTYQQARVQDALRADTWLHHTKRFKELPRYLNQEIKQEMREVFCPMDPSWRETVVTTGCTICQNALKGLERL